MYHSENKFVFASDKLKGKKPRTGQMVNRDYLKPAVAARIIKEGERFGFHSPRHSPRHSLSTWVNTNLKDVKIAQTLLRHSTPDMTAGKYIHSVPEEYLKAQAQYMALLGAAKPASEAKW